MWMLVVGAIAVVAYTGMIWSKASELGVAHERAAVAAEEAKLKVLADKAVQDGANHITDMVAAFDAGEAKGRAFAVKAKAQGDAYVVANPAFNNPVCNIGPDLVRLINSESAAMRTPAIASETDAGVPTTAPIGGRPNADGGGTVTSGQEPGRPVGTVPAQPRPIDSTGAVQGQHLQGVPAKPKPIQ